MPFLLGDRGFDNHDLPLQQGHFRVTTRASSHRRLQNQGLTDAATTAALRALRVGLSGVQAVVPPLREGPHLRAARTRLQDAAPSAD